MLGANRAYMRDLRLRSVARGGSDGYGPDGGVGPHEAVTVVGVGSTWVTSTVQVGTRASVRTRATLVATQPAAPEPSRAHPLTMPCSSPATSWRTSVVSPAGKSTTA